MKCVALLLVLFASCAAYSQPGTIVIIRHAEEPSGNSIHLSPKGERRAEALATFFQTNAIVTRHGQAVALFAPKPKPQKSRRSEETLLPTAEALNLSIREPFTEEQYPLLAKRILKDPGLKGKTVIIAWTHGSIAKLAAALGARSTPSRWKDSVYDRLYVITRSNGRVTFRDLPQRLLPGDSKR